MDVKKDLMIKANINTNTMSNMVNDKAVSLETLSQVCIVLIVILVIL